MQLQRVIQGDEFVMAESLISYCGIKTTKAINVPKFQLSEQ